MAKLGEIATVQSGGTPARSKKEYWQDGRIPWVKISDIKDKYVKTTEEKITEQGLNNSSAKIFSAGTILYTIFATLGETAILDIDAATNQAIAGIMVTDKRILPEFLYYYLVSQKENVLKMGRGVAQNNINMALLRDFEVPIFEQEKQKIVIHNLEQLDNLILLRKHQIAKLNELVKARFVEMFGDPIKNPMKWNVSRIEDIAAQEKNALKAGPFGSALKKEFYVKTGYKIYGQEQVISGNASFGDYYIDEEKYEELKNCAVQAGDILISLVGTYGKLLIIPDDYEQGIINPRLMKITLDKNKVKPVYFKYYFESDALKASMEANTHGGTMGILNLGIIRQMKIQIPPLSLQNQFSSFVERVDQQKQTAQQSLEKLELMKKALMQEYFG